MRSPRQMPSLPCWRVELYWLRSRVKVFRAFGGSWRLSLGAGMRPWHLLVAKEDFRDDVDPLGKRVSVGHAQLRD